MHTTAFLARMHGITPTEALRRHCLRPTILAGLHARACFPQLDCERCLYSLHSAHVVATRKNHKSAHTHTIFKAASVRSSPGYHILSADSPVRYTLVLVKMLTGSKSGGGMRKAGKGTYEMQKLVREHCHQRRMLCSSHLVASLTVPCLARASSTISARAATEACGSSPCSKASLLFSSPCFELLLDRHRCLHGALPPAHHGVLSCQADFWRWSHCPRGCLQGQSQDRRNRENRHSSHR